MLGFDGERTFGYVTDQECDTNPDRLRAADGGEVIFTCNNDYVRGVFHFGQYRTYCMGVSLVGINEAYDFDRTEWMGDLIDALTGYGGTLTGTVVVNQSENDEPVEGALVELPDFGMEATTDADGHFMIERIPVETFDLRVERRGYTTIDRMEVTFDGEMELDVEIRLLHPELELNPEGFEETLAAGSSENYNIAVHNPGDGPLEFTTRVRGTREEGRLWDPLQHQNTGRVLNDNRLQAVTFIDGNYYIAGGVAHDRANMLYKLNSDFRLVDAVEQAAWSNYGWRDLTYDGEYLYGVDSAYIAQIDLNTMEVTGERIPAPINPVFAVTWDPDNEIFWVANTTSDIYGINRHGDNYYRITNDRRFRTSGLFYFPEDPDGFNLYIVNNMDDASVRLYKVQPESGEISFVADLFHEEDERSGGCFITNEVHPFTWTLLVQMQSTEDWLRMYEAASNFYWMDLDPMNVQLDAGGETGMTLTLNTARLDVGQTYEAHVQFNHNTPVEGAIWMDVSLTVEALGVGDGDESVPATFGIAGAYPNPFNALTRINFTLDRATDVDLAVYDLAGRRVALLAEGYHSQGSYSVPLDAAALPAGLYIARLSDGSRNALQKLTLLK